jgi:hypothetical protein
MKFSDLTTKQQLREVDRLLRPRRLAEAHLELLLAGDPGARPDVARWALGLVLRCAQRAAADRKPVPLSYASELSGLLHGGMPTPTDAEILLALTAAERAGLATRQGDLIDRRLS